MSHWSCPAWCHICVTSHAWCLTIPTSYAWCHTVPISHAWSHTGSTGHAWCHNNHIMHDVISVLIVMHDDASVMFKWSYGDIMWDESWYATLTCFLLLSNCSLTKVADQLPDTFQSSPINNIVVADWLMWCSIVPCLVHVAAAQSGSSSYPPKWHYPNTPMRI